VTAYRTFGVQVRRLHRLSPTFLRVTFTSAGLASFADNGFDQRIKLVLPLPGRGVADMPDGPDWFARWRALPDDRRNPLRTYTVRAARPGQREVDVDVVLHGDGGPAARWAQVVRPGDELALVGPNAGYDGDHGGLEYRPPARMGATLLAGDETAVPAIAAILERLPAGARGEALLEVPETADELDLHRPQGVRVKWLARNGADHGTHLVPAVQTAAGRLLTDPKPGQHLDDADVDEELWDTPQEPVADGLYAWLAGEARVIRTLRRHLVTERGLDRRSVAFMGYWRRGHAEENE
jgi:NADPH-dependent ferric siderophore reductase